MAQEIYIRGCGLSSFGKRKEDLSFLLTEAALIAIEDSGIEKIDAIFIGVMNIEEFVGESNVGVILADKLGLSGIPSTRVETASSTGAGVFLSAFYALSSGYMKNVLVVAGEKMTHLPTPKTTKILSEVIATEERRYGASMPALAALVAQRYAYENRLSYSKLEEALSSVAIKNHKGGYFNPFAHFQKKINKEIYSKSSYVAFPLRLFDCAPITDGAAAIVLSAEEGKIVVKGIGQATDTWALSKRSILTSFTSTRIAAQKAYKTAGYTPDQIDLAEIHDAFTIFEIIGSEDVGFFPKGKGWKAAIRGETSLGGKIPINISGGLKARGHPIGASGLAQIVELYKQMTGQAPPTRQVRPARIALSQSIGGLGNNNLVIILAQKKSNLFHIPGKYGLPEVIKSAPLSSKKPPRRGKASIMSFTVLYRPPEGFSAPLVLSLLSIEKGLNQMAIGKIKETRIERLHINKKVIFFRENGLYYFIPATFKTLFIEYILRLRRLFKIYQWKVKRKFF